MILIRKIAVLFSFFLLFAPSQAVNMSRCLERMPSSVREELSPSMVKDMLDFHQAGQRAVVKNRFGGSSVLHSISDSTLQMQVSAQLLVEMRLLPITKDSVVIAVVENYGDTIVDGHISFYTTDWQPIAQSDCFEVPILEQFLPKMTPELVTLWNDMASELSFSFINYSFANRGNELVLTWDISPSLSSESQKRAQPLLVNNSRRYLWKDGFFTWQSQSK